MPKHPEIQTVMSRDGSHSLFSAYYGEHYHSLEGAVTESQHIFINNGLLKSRKKEIAVLEMGFGTGLNAFLSLRESRLNPELKINYTGIEKHPLENTVTEQLNYPEITGLNKRLFTKMHKARINVHTKIIDNFFLTKIVGDIRELKLKPAFDLVFYDAFSPEKQAELWTDDIFIKIRNLLNPGALLLTYSSKGTVKQALRNTGFKVSRLPGPPGKRHILKAALGTNRIQRSF